MPTMPPPSTSNTFDTEALGDLCHISLHDYEILFDVDDYLSFDKELFSTSPVDSNKQEMIPPRDVAVSPVSKCSSMVVKSPTPVLAPSLKSMEPIPRRVSMESVSHEDVVNNKKNPSQTPCDTVKKSAKVKRKHKLSVKKNTPHKRDSFAKKSMPVSRTIAATNVPSGSGGFEVATSTMPMQPRVVQRMQCGRIVSVPQLLYYFQGKNTNNPMPSASAATLAIQQQNASPQSRYKTSTTSFFNSNLRTKITNSQKVKPGTLQKQTVAKWKQVNFVKRDEDTQTHRVDNLKVFAPHHKHTALRPPPITDLAMNLDSECLAFMRSLTPHQLYNDAVHLNALDSSSTRTIFLKT